VTGQVVVIAGMMVVGADGPADAVDHGEVMGLLCQHWQVFAKSHTGSGRTDGLEWAAVFQWCIGLHVPRVDVRGAATEKEQNCGTRGSAGGAVGAGGAGGGGAGSGKAVPRNTSSGGDQESTALHGGFLFQAEGGRCPASG